MNHALQLPLRISCEVLLGTKGMKYKTALLHHNF